jgi:hypothetical protein
MGGATRSAPARRDGDLGLNPIGREISLDLNWSADRNSEKKFIKYYMFTL